MISFMFKWDVKVLSYFSILIETLSWFLFQGAGAFEVAARQYLVNEVKKTVQGVIELLYVFLLKEYWKQY